MPNIKTNLDFLREAEEGMSLDRLTRFDAYVLGALSVHTSRELWLQVIESARVRFALEDNASEVLRLDLEFLGWGIIGEPQPGVLVSGPSGDSIDVTGYNAANYWLGSGRFRGPDAFGIVPVYRDQDGAQFPKEARLYPHLA